MSSCKIDTKQNKQKKISVNMVTGFLIENQILFLESTIMRIIHMNMFELRNSISLNQTVL